MYTQKYYIHVGGALKKHFGRFAYLCSVDTEYNKANTICVNYNIDSINLLNLFGTFHVKNVSDMRYMCVSLLFWIKIFTINNVDVITLKC